MKKLLIIIDGMDDESLLALGGRTPREVAFMPGLDFMMANGHNSMMSTIPYGNTPSSETAILNILGNHVEPGFSGRSWLEAIGIGVNVSSDDLCMRCNLIKIEDDIIVSHGREEITEQEVLEIIQQLNIVLSHQKDPKRKVKILEEIDKNIISPILKYGRDLEIVVQPDHATSSVTGRHLDKPVEVTTYIMKRVNES